MSKSLKNVSSFPLSLQGRRRLKSGLKDDGETIKIMSITPYYNKNDKIKVKKNILINATGLNSEALLRQVLIFLGNDLIFYLGSCILTTGGLLSYIAPLIYGRVPIFIIQYDNDLNSSYSNRYDMLIYDDMNSIPYMTSTTTVKVINHTTLTLSNGRDLNNIISGQLSYLSLNNLDASAATISLNIGERNDTVITFTISSTEENKIINGIEYDMILTDHQNRTIIVPNVNIQFN
jgi:hypothetical protein